jgi:hypothetical protein
LASDIDKDNLKTGVAPGRLAEAYQALKLGPRQNLFGIAGDQIERQYFLINI